MADQSLGLGSDPSADGVQRYRAHADILPADLNDDGPVVLYHRPSHCTVVINRHGFDIIMTLQAAGRPLSVDEIAAHMSDQGRAHLRDALDALAERGLVVEE